MENPIIIFPLNIETEIWAAFRDCGMSVEYVIELERLLRREAAKVEQYEEQLALLQSQRACCDVEELERLAKL